MTSTEWRDLDIGRCGNTAVCHHGRWFALASGESSKEPGPTGFKFLMYYRLDFESRGVIRTMLKVNEYNKAAYVNQVKRIRPTTALGEIYDD